MTSIIKDLPCRVAVVGTGFMSAGFISLTDKMDDIAVTRVLTRRSHSELAGFPGREILTDSIDDLLENSDIVLECSGDVHHATEVIDQTLLAGKKVITMNAEFQVTTGSAFVNKGFLTESDGDQPGTLASMHEYAVGMGFKPLFYGNIKGFLNKNPTPEEMEYWAKKSGVRNYQIVSFTDGTKVEVETVLVANAFGLDIVPGEKDCEPVNDFRQIALDIGTQVLGTKKPLSDYLISTEAPPGVFIVASHDEDQIPYLDYLKMGKGPAYMLLHNAHLCHLEIPRTIRRVWRGGDVLLNNTATPRYSVKAIAKKKLSPGDRITSAIGSFELRGKAQKILDDPDHVPIGLLRDAVIKRPLEAGEVVRWSDVDIPDSKAMSSWKAILETLIK